MKLVIDTNVVISGIFWKGIPNNILIDWFNGCFEVFISPPILQEYEDVIKRMGAGLTEEDIRKWMELIIINSSIVPFRGDLKVIEADPDDDKFIECAVYSQADYIVSGDKHLLKLKEYQGIEIFSPSRFLEQHKT